jgi:ChrB-like protein
VVTKTPEPTQVPPRRWLLLLYKVKPKPSAGRVYVWRKLKRLGALLLHDAVWVLPDTLRTREHFQWLAAEIIEMGGEALFWEAQLVLGPSEDALVQQFVGPIEAAYKALLKDIGKKDPDWGKLSQQYQQLKQRDYFQSSLGTQVREALTSARGGEGQ